MILAFDVGNTHINFGVYNNESKTWKCWRVKTDIDKASDEYGILILQILHHNNISVSQIDGMILSSVVSPIMFNLESGLRKYIKLEPMIVSHNLDLGININYDDPSQLGPDRICNAVGAFTMYGGPVMVVDMGTATTINVINKNGDFLGGSILPGIISMSNALNGRIPNLPKANINKPNGVISNNTLDAINNGIIYGYAGMIDELIRKSKKELQEDDVTVIGTGGLIQTIVDEVECISEIYDNLTLEGARIIFERNK